MNSKIYTALAIGIILAIGIAIGASFSDEIAYRDGYQVGCAYCKNNH